MIYSCTAIYCRSMSSSTAMRWRVCWVSTARGKWMKMEGLQLYIWGFLKMIPTSPWVSILNWSIFGFGVAILEHLQLILWRDGCTRCSSSGENRLRRPSHLLSYKAGIFPWIFHVSSICKWNKASSFNGEIQLTHMPDESWVRRMDTAYRTWGCCVNSHQQN